MASEIRLGQLIAPFGPGSLYTDKNGVPNIICGLDFWYKQKDEKGRWYVKDASMRKHVIDEPRLSALLGVPQFRQPPEYCIDSENPELSRLEIHTHRFPTWYVDALSGKMRQFNLETRRLPTPAKGEPPALWRPVRFVSVCSHGHISDFPWKEWCGCECPSDSALVLNDSGGPDLRSIRVSCKRCHKSKTLAGAMGMELNEQRDEVKGSGLRSAGIDCKGERPWLGRTAQSCNEPLVAVLINQSNIYFSKTISSIYLPDMTSTRSSAEMQKILRQEDRDLTSAKIFFQMGEHEAAINKLKEVLKPHYEELPNNELIIQAMESLSRGTPLPTDALQPALPESKTLTFRRAEYNVLRNEVGPGVEDELRVITSVVPDNLKHWFGRVSLVERLRETRVFYGFERLVRSRDPLEDMPPSAMNQLFLEPPEPAVQWLPAVKNYGEGIYIELSEDAVQQWIADNSVWIHDRLAPAFVARMGNESYLLPPQASDCTPEWAARYLLVHTLAHIMINQMVFESGYSSASLKERIFVSSDPAAPMAAFLVYTGAGDSEGSLGGLVRIGRPELLEPMLLRALSRASWCSADPVCSENLGGTGSRRVNKAACHACVLLPETACETINSGLDRAMVVGTPEAPLHGFLSDLLQGFSI